VAVTAPPSTVGLADLRASLHEWLEAHREDFVGARRGAEPQSLEGAVVPEVVLQRALWEAGFSRWGWPEHCGGKGGSAVLRAAVYEQLVLDGYRIPQPMLTIETLGPAVVALAPKLTASHLGALLRGDELWCQGFSEPEAGSDLASLRCRATAAGNDWVVSGQKLWSSLGTVAQRTAMLVRTGDAGHRGITMLLVDLDAPGCEVRPIRASSGRTEFAELFFDETPVGGERVVGEVNGGWAVAMYLLQWERGMYGWMRQAVLHARLADLLRAVPDPSPEDADRVVEAWVRVSALRSSTARTVQRLAVGENPGPEVSVDKVVLATAEQSVLECERRMLPVDFALGDEVADEVFRGDWFFSRMASIYGGAIEIQRTLVAERVLGLPRSAR
jgi:alkylation response protein AidB-like acyl-CoA dehydrogenase